MYELTSVVSVEIRYLNVFSIMVWCLVKVNIPQVNLMFCFVSLFFLQIKKCNKNIIHILPKFCALQINSIIYSILLHNFHFQFLNFTVEYRWLSLSRNIMAPMYFLKYHKFIWFFLFGFKTIDFNLLMSNGNNIFAVTLHRDFLALVLTHRSLWMKSTWFSWITTPPVEKHIVALWVLYFLDLG